MVWEAQNYFVWRFSPFLYPNSLQVNLEKRTCDLIPSIRLRHNNFTVFKYCLCIYQCIGRNTLLRHISIRCYTTVEHIWSLSDPVRLCIISTFPWPIVEEKLNLEVVLLEQLCNTKHLSFLTFLIVYMENELRRPLDWQKPWNKKIW